MSDLTLAVCDGHALPFQDECFDGAIVQAVLEHVMDPDRVVRESFDEISSGAAHGPGTMLAVCYRYFLRSFARSRLSAGLTLVFASFSAFWLKYCDRFLLSRTHADDAAAGFAFLGRKTARTYTDREIVGMYDDPSLGRLGTDSREESVPSEGLARWQPSGTRVYSRGRRGE